MGTLPPYYYNAPEQTFGLAAYLRRRTTEAEEVLWQKLRRKQLKGYHFRRQHPIGYYVADFYCHRARLVVEVDGPVHAKRERREHDENRDAVMTDADIVILRFRNERIFKELSEVLEEIKAQLMVRE